MVKKNSRLNLIYSLLSVIFTSFLLVITVFGWYVSNRETSITGVSASTGSGSPINILNEVTAVRHNLTGNTITDTYTRNSSDGVLYLTKRITRDVTGQEPTTTTETYTLADKKSFNINELLPGEYVDITVGFNMNSGNNGKEYAIELYNVTGEAFMVDTYTHYATGAFKYASVSLANEAGTKIVDNSASLSYTWFNEYSISANDSLELSHSLIEGSWQDSYENLYYTFRIYEDFSQYYNLISQASGSYGALLSKKKVTIGSIFFKEK